MWKVPVQVQEGKVLRKRWNVLHVYRMCLCTLKAVCFNLPVRNQYQHMVLLAYRFLLPYFESCT